MPEDKTKTDEQSELEKLLNSDEEDISDEEENKDKEDEEENKGDEEEDQEESENSEGEGHEEGSEEGADKGKEDEFKGKSREEVIKMLQEERKKNTKPTAEPIKPEEDKDKKEDEEELTVPTAEELQKMTPSDFAKWVLARIDEGVKKTIESQEKVRSAVKKEIADAKKEHNLGDPDYRKMVLAIIEAASAKGTVIPLKEACQQVDAFLGKHKKGEGDQEESEQLSDEEKSRLKKAKAQVESGAGAPTKPEGSDAEMTRIQKALEGSGQSPLGGLGI